MPLARTFDLYELWCFLRLVRAAVEEYPSTGVDLNSLFITSAAGDVTIAASSVIVKLGTEMELCFKKQYREYWIEKGGEGSFSRTMIPDIVLAGTGLGGNPDRRVIVLDAKYRINNGLNDALNSIHTYRDALVQESRGQINGIVTAAYLLTPHEQALDTHYKSTPVPGRLFYPEYREKFRFGAVTLRPGMNQRELRDCLKSIVEDATA
jgi:hypothetical protein